jgi:hypothetical protein
MPLETPCWLDDVTEPALPKPTPAKEALLAEPEEPAIAAEKGPPTTPLAPLALEPAPAPLLVPPAMTPPANAGAVARPRTRADAIRIFFICYFP